MFKTPVKLTIEPTCVDGIAAGLQGHIDQDPQYTYLLK